MGASCIGQYPQTVHIAHNLGDNFAPPHRNFVDKAVVAAWPRDVHFVLPEGAVRTTRQVPGSDPRNGPGNRVRRPQGRWARDPAAIRDCDLSKPPNPPNGWAPTVPSGAFVCAGARAASRPGSGCGYPPTVSLDAPAPHAGLARPGRGVLDRLDGRGPRRQPDLRLRAGLPARDGRRPATTGSRSSGLFSCPDLRRRRAARARCGASGPTSTAARRSSSAARSSRRSSSGSSRSPASRGSSPWRCCSSASSSATPA